MRRSIRSSLALALVGLLGTAFAGEQVVNVYNWSDYIDPQVLEDFQKETGIKVVYDVYDGNEILETKLLAGSSGYDVVVPSGYFLRRQIDAGVFARLDRSRLPNFAALSPQINQAVTRYDPDNAHSATYMWGTVGIGYNVDAVKKRLPDAPLDSWQLALDPARLAALKDCGVHMLDAPAEIIPIVLNYLGENPSSTDPKVIAKAEEHLKKLRPYVKKFHSQEYLNGLANGDVCLAIGYSGDILQARNRAKEAGRGVDVAYTLPREGTLMWFDLLAIPADAPHKDAALAFINFMLKPETAAKNSNFVRYATANQGALPLLDPTLRNDPAVFPAPEVQAKLFVPDAYPPKTQQLVTRTWTKVKSAL